MSDLDFNLDNILNGGGVCNEAYRCSCITKAGTRCKNCVLDGMTTCYIHSKTGCKTTEDFLSSPVALPFISLPSRSTTPTYVARAPSPIAYKYYGNGILGANNAYRFRNLPKYRLDASYNKPIVAPPIAYKYFGKYNKIEDIPLDLLRANPIYSQGRWWSKDEYQRQFGQPARMIPPNFGKPAQVIQPVVAAVQAAAAVPAAVVAPAVAAVVAPAAAAVAAVLPGMGTKVPGTNFKVGDVVYCSVTESLAKTFTITGFYKNPSNEYVVEGKTSMGEKVTYNIRYCKLLPADKILPHPIQDLITGSPSLTPTYYNGFVSQASDEELLEAKHDPFHNKFTPYDFQRLAVMVAKYDANKVLRMYFNNRFMGLFKVTPGFINNFYRTINYIKQRYYNNVPKKQIIITFLLEGFAVEMMSNRNWDLTNVLDDDRLLELRSKDMYNLYSEYWDRVIKPNWSSPKYRRYYD